MKTSSFLFLVRCVLLSRLALAHWWPDRSDWHGWRKLNGGQFETSGTTGARSLGGWAGRRGALEGGGGERNDEPNQRRPPPPSEMLTMNLMNPPPRGYDPADPPPPARGRLPFFQYDAGIRLLVLSVWPLVAYSRLVADGCPGRHCRPPSYGSVSYTHQTLPTIDLVKISEDDVS